MEVANKWHRTDVIIARTTHLHPETYAETARPTAIGSHIFPSSLSFSPSLSLSLPPFPGTLGPSFLLDNVLARNKGLTELSIHR